MKFNGNCDCRLDRRLGIRFVSQSMIEFGLLGIQIVDDSICRPALPKLRANAKNNSWHGKKISGISDVRFWISMLAGNFKTGIVTKAQLFGYVKWSQKFLRKSQWSLLRGKTVDFGAKSAEFIARQGQNFLVNLVGVGFSLCGWMKVV